MKLTHWQVVSSSVRVIWISNEWFSRCDNFIKGHVPILARDLCRGTRNIASQLNGTLLAPQLLFVLNWALAPQSSSCICFSCLFFSLQTFLQRASKKNFFSFFRLSIGSRRVNSRYVLLWSSWLKNNWWKVWLAYLSWISVLVVRS